MQTIQFIPCEEFSSGTSLQGSIEASYNDLVRMFGKPAYEGIGDKVTTEFVIDYQVSDSEGESKYGTFTLYDWYFARNLNDDYAVTKWNVGGTSYDDSFAADLAQKIFEKTDDSLVYAKLHELEYEDTFIL
jgi:hypothetical protein